MIRLEALSSDHLPWTDYNIFQDAEKVGQCAFKAPPKNGKVEMAYYVFEPFQGQGIATEVCRLLTALSVAADPGVAVTARTLMEENASVFGNESTEAESQKIQLYSERASRVSARVTYCLVK